MWFWMTLQLPVLTDNAFEQAYSDRAVTVSLIYHLASNKETLSRGGQTTLLRAS
jgi:hypothetical protein